MAQPQDQNKQTQPQDQNKQRANDSDETKKLIELLTRVFQDVEGRLGARQIERTPDIVKAISEYEKLKKDLLEPLPWSFPALDETAATTLDEKAAKVWQATTDETVNRPSKHKVIQPSSQSPAPATQAKKAT